MPRRSDAAARERRPPGSDLVREVVESRLGIDARALGTFRIALGLLLLADLLALRVPELVTFYTDEGLYPRSALAEVYPAFETASLHALSGAAWFQGLLVAVAGAFAVLLAVGYRTRLATASSLVLLASLIARNPHAVNGGDTILLSFLLLGLFLPLETRWSLDARRRGGTPSREQVLSLATVTILVHFVLIYVTNAILKFRSESWMTGTAVRRIFHLEQYLTPLGSALAEFSPVLTAVNWIWTALLASAVLLLAVTGWPRLVLIAGFVGAHLGMAVTMRLGAFPFVMIAGLLLFLPSSTWARLERVVAEADLGRRTGTSRQSTASDGGAPGRARPGTGADTGTDTDSPFEALRPASVRVRRIGRAASTALLACLLVSSVLWQAAAVGAPLGPLDQNDDEELGSWAFFAPNPPDAYSWYAVEATLESGETITALPGGDVRFDRPPDGTDAYPSPLWKRYGMDVRYAGDAHYEPAAEYSCAQFDREVDSVTIFHVEQPVGPDGPRGEPDWQERITAAC